MKLVSERTSVTEEVTLYRPKSSAGRYSVGSLVLQFAERGDPLPHHIEVTGGGEGIERRSVRVDPETLERMAAVMRVVRARSGDNRLVCVDHGYRPAHELVEGVGLVCKECREEDEA